MISFVIICIVLISSRGVVSAEEGNEKYGLSTADFNTSPNAEEDDSCNKCEEWEHCIPETANKFICVCKDPDCGKGLLDPCDPNPCENGGTCVQDYGSYHCICANPFFGDNCLDVQSCAEPCENGRTCKWNGEKMECENPCEPNPCENGGTCMITQGSYQCTCADSFIGQNCIDKLEIRSNTTTYSPTTSIPTPDEIDFCYEKPCQNGGTCVRENSDYHCLCLSDYSGKDCNEESKTSRTTAGTTLDPTTSRTTPGTTRVSMSPTTSEGTTNVSMYPTTSEDTTTESKSPTTTVDTTIVSISSTTSKDTTIVSISSTTSKDTTIESKSPTASVDTTIGFKSTTTSEVTTIDHDLCVSSPCLNNGSCISINNSVRCNCTNTFSGEFCDTGVSGVQSSSNSIVYACTGSVGAIVFVFLIGFSVLWNLKRVKRRKKESYFHNADLSSMESENSRTYII